MNDSNDLRDALRVAVPVEPEEKVAQRREVLLSVIEREIYATPRRIEQEQARVRWRSRGRVLGVAAALVSTLGLGMLMSEFEGGSNKNAELAASVGSASDASGVPKEAVVHRSLTGQSFETGPGHEKILQMAGDTKVTLAAHTRVFIGRDSEHQQHLNLTSGGLLLSVPANRKDRSVQVQTSHATVQVTGTVFGVEVGRFAQPPGTPARTRVSVERGQVVVLHAAGRAVLSPGDTWLSPLLLGTADTESQTREARRFGTPPVAESSASQRSAQAAADRGSSGVPSSSVPSSGVPSSSPPATFPPSSARETESHSSGSAPILTAERARVVASDAEHTEEPSTLAAQNNLLERALTAESRGNREHAHELIQRFLQRYPRSPLRASALAIQKRLELAD